MLRRVKRGEWQSLDHDIDLFVAKSLGEQVEADVLYHYTSLDAAESILKSRSIWAKEARKAKGGERDLEAATPMVLDVLKQIGRERQGGAREACGHAIDIYDRAKISEIAKVFVACFTANGDNEAMWSDEFGCGGRGVAIGFQMLRSVRETILERDSGSLWCKVRYTLEPQRSELKACLDSLLIALSHELSCIRAEKLPRLRAVSGLGIRVCAVVQDAKRGQARCKPYEVLEARGVALPNLGFRDVMSPRVHPRADAVQMQLSQRTAGVDRCSEPAGGALDC